MIAEGKYVARAEDIDFGVADTGSEYVAMSFCIMEGPHQGDRYTWRSYFNTSENAERSLKSLRYCGWDGDDLESISSEQLHNLVQVTIEHQEYEGKTYPRIVWVNQLGGLAIKTKMDESTKRAFAQRMRGLAMKIPRSLANGVKSEDRPTQQPSPQQENRDDFAPPEHTDDELPF